MVSCLTPAFWGSATKSGSVCVPLHGWCSFTGGLALQGPPVWKDGILALPLSLGPGWSHAPPTPAGFLWHSGRDVHWSQGLSLEPLSGRWQSCLGSCPYMCLPSFARTLPLLALLRGTPHESSPGCLPRDSVLRAGGPELLPPQAHPPETSPVWCCHPVGTLRGLRDSSCPWTQPPGWTPASLAPPHGPPDSQPRPLLAGGTSLSWEKDGCDLLAPMGGALSVCLAPIPGPAPQGDRASPGAGAHAGGQEWHAGTELQGQWGEGSPEF